MAVRLPIVGGDSGAWGDILNSYLQPLNPLLTWPPPVLRNPTTITLDDSQQSSNKIVVNMTVGQDYILRGPTVLHYPVLLIGGHHVVWIGGEVNVTVVPDNIAIQFSGVCKGGGVMHLEGLYLHGTGATDGIEGGQWANQSVASGTLADAICQIQNCRVILGQSDANGSHEDVYQHYGGWKDLRIDRLTGESDYQGLFLCWEDTPSNNQGVLSHFDVRNTNLRDRHQYGSGQSFQTLLHFGDRGGIFSATTHQQQGHLRNVWIRASENTFDQETYPNSGTANAGDGTVVHSRLQADGTATWEDTWGVSGILFSGVPPGGDFCPAGLPGINYSSPGYQIPIVPVVGSNILLAQTAAVASVAAVTSPNDGQKHTYRVSMGVTITTHASESINAEVTYTDDNGTARTCIIPLCAEAGTFAAAANTADSWKGSVVITVNPNTAVTALTAGTFTGATYNVSALIEPLA